MAKKKSAATRRAEAQAVAERAAAVRREQEVKERRRRNLVVGAVVLVALVVIGGIGYAVQSARDTTGQVSTPPQGVVDEYAVPLGPAEAPVTIDVYEDYLCPFCALYESATREQFREYAASGDVQVQYHPVSILDDYSTRAMSAQGVVLDSAGREAALRFHDLLFANQPPEDGDGLSDEQLVDLAVEAGAERAEVTGPIEAVKFEPWVENATDAFSREGLSGTPSVLVDGEQIGGDSIDALVANTEAGVEEALPR